MTKTNVLLLFGGESPEHEVSISSATNVFDVINKEKYEINLCFIDRAGKWWLADSIDGRNELKNENRLLPVLGEGCFRTAAGQTVKSDVILPIIHGTNCEDGTVQGLARLLHIPIVGCGVEASAIAMDKVVTKQLLEQNGIKTVPYEAYVLGETMPSYEQLSIRLGNVLFIKPARNGSSVGIHKVSSADELAPSIQDALRYDSKILIEKGVNCRELEVAVLGNGPSIQASPVGEIVPDRDFYDYDSKYDSSSQTKTVIPAEISQEISDKIRDIAKRAFQIIDGAGLSRVDFFLADDGTIFFNEINTLPGFTNISMYPKLWQAADISYSDLIDKLIQLAIN